MENDKINQKLLNALERCVPWLGKMIADGAHMNSVAPLDCENALRQAEDAIKEAKELPKPTPYHEPTQQDMDEAAMYE